MKLARSKVVVAVVGLVAAGLAGWWVYSRSYARPRAELLKQIAAYEAGLSFREDELLKGGPLRERLRRIAGTTLGSEEEKVSAALRTAANQILAAQGLGDTRVSTARPEAVRNPAAMRVEEFANNRSARNEPDFLVVSTTARGIGSLEQALRTMATLEAQRWVHRVDQWTIIPVDKERERFELTVEFSSIYFPEPHLRPAGETNAIAWEPLSEARFAPYNSILARAAFKEPARRAPKPEGAVAQAPAPKPGPVTPPPPPYADWRVTAVVAGQGGAELWLRNVQSGQSATLGPGERVLDAVFVEAAGETATVEIAGARYLVKLGQTLADRLAEAR